MASEARTRPRKRPSQDRAVRTVDAILEATAHILRENGADGLSTNRVAKRAGVSIGSLYQYFPNKTALMVELARQHSSEQVAAVAAHLAEKGTSGTIEEVVRRFIDATVSVHRADPALHLALTSEVLLRGEGVALQDHARARELVAAFIRMRSDVEVADPEMTAWVLVTAVESAVHMALFEDAGEMGFEQAEVSRLDDPAFTEALVAMCVRTLGVRS